MMDLISIEDAYSAIEKDDPYDAIEHIPTVDAIEITYEIKLALRRAKPVPPTFSFDECSEEYIYDNGYPSTSHYCPVCDTWLVSDGWTDIKQAMENIKFCPHCGQAIDTRYYIDDNPDGDGNEAKERDKRNGNL